MDYLSGYLQKENILMNTSTSSDNNNNKKSQENIFQIIQKTILKNSSGTGKKVFICISTFFINTPYTQLIYNFNYSSQSIFIFLWRRKHEHCMEQLECLSRNSILTLPFTVQNLFIIPIRSAHKLKYKNPTP